MNWGFSCHRRRHERSSPHCRGGRKLPARRTRPICWPGTTATAACCRGARARGETPDPYRVWLSEIMLQQTTVKTVAPYYARFLARWPTVEALAAASLDDVLRAWAGLGYYARARNLHACARAVVERHGGKFPASLEALARAAGHRRLHRRRGGGDRVRWRRRCRWTAMSSAWWRGCSRSRRSCRRPSPTIKRLAASLLPARRAGDFAQALMDLGATICSPKRPACALCPWNEACLALRARRSGDLPAQGAKARRPLAPRRGLRGAARRRPRAAAHAAGKGPARRHDRGAGQRLGA